MRNLYFVFAVLFIGMNLVVSGCGPRAFTKGGYDDPNKVILLDDKFGENDMQVMSNYLVTSLTDYGKVKTAAEPPVVIVGKVRNRTSEHIDMTSLTDMIRTSVSNSGKFRFAANESRDDVAEEYAYQQGKHVDQKTAKGSGHQIGADYLITGELSSIVQEVGSDKVVDYKLTLNLVNLSTNILDWTKYKEVRKKYRKKYIGN